MSQTPTRNGLMRSILLYGVVVISLLTLFAHVLYTRSQTASAATSSTLNFQARLLNSAGNVVPDGNYHIEFKIYDSAAAGGSAQGACSLDSSTDDCWWVETRTTGNLVRVVNGYFTVNLGSVTAFGSSINWDQEHWLTMNIGGTSGPSWDGEMSPRMKLTAVPYAFRAGAVMSTAGALTGDQLVQLGPSSLQGLNSANTAIRINQTGAGDLLQLQASGNARLTLTNAGALSVASTGAFSGASVTIGTSSQAGSLILNDGSSNTGTISLAAIGQNTIYTLPDALDGSDTICLQDLANCGSGAGNILQNGNSFSAAVTIGSNDNNDLNFETFGSTRATIQADGDLAVDTSTLFVDATANRVGVGINGSLGAQLHVSGAGGGASLFRISDTTATARDVMDVADGGAVTFSNQTNSTSAFLVQDASGQELIQVDTTNGRIGIGEVPNTSLLTIGTNTNTAAGGITFGTDTNLYRNGAGSLKTDGELIADSYVCANISLVSNQVCVGATATATTGPGIAFGSSFDTNLYRSGASVLMTDDEFDAASYICALAGGANVSCFGATGPGTPGAGIAFGSSFDTNIYRSGANTLATDDSFSVGGNVQVTGTYNTNTFNSSTLTFGASGAASVQSAAGQNLTINSGTTGTLAIGDDASAETINIGTGAAVKTLTVGSTNSTSSTRIQGGSGGIILGSSAGQGQLTNNGSTLNSTLAVSDDANGGALGGGLAASASVDVYTAISINQTTAGQTITLPSPTSATAGRIVFVTNIGSTSFSLHGVTIPTSSAQSYVWNGSAWVPASSTASVNLQNAYNNGSSGDQVVQLSSSNDSIIIRNPSSSGTNSGTYSLLIDQLATDTTGGLSIQSAGTGNLLLVTDTTATSRDVLTIADGGITTFRTQTDNASGFRVQNATGTTIFNVDTSNSRIGINTAAPSYDLSFGEGANRTLGIEARSSNAAGRNLTVSAGAAGTGGSAFSGGNLVLQGGIAAGTGNAIGGGVTITGGAGVGTGVQGLVNIYPTSFISSGSTQSYGVNSNITGVDSYSTAAINATTTGLTITLPVPHATNQVVGRIFYVTAVDNSNDFTLLLGGTSISIAMKENSTATLIWNGTGWTAAGASSSTDLQSAYNNTLTSAGGAELILNPSGGAADGLTIRNNGTTPIIGPILEAQTSIGSNLFSVNNNATEYANNGGAESTTFSMWTAAPAGGSVSRYTTAGNNIATGQASVFVDTSSTANTGVANTLSGTLTANLKYTVSYAVRHTSSSIAFNTLDTIFSRDGTNTSTTACATGSTATNGIWTRITCSFTAPSSGITASNAIFIRHSDAVEHDFYIDNLSVTVSADVNHAADGSVDSALGTNWTNFGTLDALTRETTIIYDTGGSVLVNTPNNADRGVRNNLTITPATSTQYLVSFYARSSNTFNDIRVRYTRDGGTNFVSCVDYNTQSVSTSAFTKITCLLTTDSTTATDPDLVIDQPTGSDRIFYIDALSLTLNTNNSNNIQVGAGNKGGPVTLFTLDRSSTAPIAANNDAYLGSMYYDTSTGRIQCYEADGWGACGAAPDNIVNLNPEYAGAVLNGTGVGTMTADFCAEQAGVLNVNTSLCDTGQAKNYYRWTSPQATQQTYSIYVTYQLPATFNGFASDDTVQLVGRVDSTSNASVTYEMYKSTGSAVTQCGSSETNVITGGGGAADTWYTYGINGNESTGCSFTASSAGNFIIFKINLKANSNANAYVSTLSFTTTGR